MVVSDANDNAIIEINVDANVMVENRNTLETGLDV